VNQNFILEVINGANFQLTTFFLMWSIFHLYQEFHQRQMTWREALFFPSVAFVVALTNEKFGTAVTRGVVWTWRMGGGGVPFNNTQNTLLILGACFTCGGLLWLIAIITARRFGPWPWRLAAIWVGLYVASSVWSEYWL
jgi:hypothetical protein